MKKIFLIMVLTSLFIISCDIENPAAPDDVSPRVIVTYPGNWDSVYEEQLILNFEIIEENIDSVLVFMNGNIISSSLEEPYQLTINMADYEVGLQTLYCKVIDENGNIGISTLTNFYWNEEPSSINVSIIRPVSWEEFETTEIEVNLQVQSEQEIDNVAVFVDGQLAYTFLQAPFITTLQLNSLGSHNIYAVCTDILDGTGNSEIINFSIISPDLESPSGYITYPANWMSVSGNFEIRVSAIDNVAIQKVELYIDGIYFDEISSSPYNFSIHPSDINNGDHTVYAKIIDTSLNYSHSQLININVNN